MKTVLVITHAFPPAAGMGTLRICRFMKYLPQYGWKAHVLTIASVVAGAPQDDTMMSYIPADTSVNRVAATDLNSICRRLERWHLSRLAYRLRRFIGRLPPDQWLFLWLPQAYWEARRILSKNTIDAIFTSSFPCTMHLVGYLLKKTIGKPWVADFRDEWSLHPHRSWPARWQKKLDGWLERQVVQASDHIVAATEEYSSDLSLLSQSTDTKFTTLANSFDLSEYPVANSANDGKFTITYVGMLYGGYGFLSAIETLVQEQQIPKDRIEVIVVGKVQPIAATGFDLSAKIALLGSIVRCVGWLPFAEAMRYLVNADLLLLLLDSHRGAATIPGKTFEYIGAGRPILALVPDGGPAAELIRRTETGTVVEPEDVEGVKVALFEFYRRWEEGRLYMSPNWGEINKYRIEVLTGRLAAILDVVCCEPSKMGSGS